MSLNVVTPLTPITSKADRNDHRVRLLEEAVLELRGSWPAAACGIIETVNQAYGFIFRGSGDADDAVGAAMTEALLLVEKLYGPEVVADLRLRAGPEHPIEASPPSPSARARQARKRRCMPERALTLGA